MANGRTATFQKNATLANFDGSSSSKTLWIHPGQAVSGIQLSLAPNATAAADGRCVARFVLQAFWGATPNGSGGWTGGSWTTFWSFVLDAFSAGTAGTTGLVKFEVGKAFVEFDPPLSMPQGFHSSILTGNDHAAKGGRVAPNTHAGTEVAGEWDIRGFWTSIQSSGNSAIDADANVQMLASETT